VFEGNSLHGNGNSFDAAGPQLSCGQPARRVVRYEHDGSITVVADTFEGKRLSCPNDVVTHLLQGQLRLTSKI